MMGLGVGELAALGLWGLIVAIVGVLGSMFFPRSALTVGLLVYTLPMLQIGPGVDTRAALLVVLAGLGARIMGQRVRRLRVRSGAVLLAVLLMLVTAALSLFWTVDTVQTGATMLTTLLALLVMWFGIHLMDARDLALVAFTVTALLVGLSLLTGFVGGGSPYEGGRLRGLFENANALAIFTVILAPAAAAVCRGWWLLIWWTVAMTTAVMSGSRGGSLALVVFFSIAIWSIVRNGLARSALVLAVIGAGYWLSTLDFDDLGEQETSSVLRTNNSRADYWDAAVRDINVGWPYGYGGGSASSQGEAGINFVLKALYEYGFVGAMLCIVVVTLLVIHSTRNLVAFAALVSILVNTNFEGWLMTFGNSFTILAFMVLLTLPQARAQMRGPASGTDHVVPMSGRSARGLSPSGTRRVSRGVLAG